MRDQLVSEDSEESQASPNRGKWPVGGVVGEYLGWISDTRFRSIQLQRVSLFMRVNGRRIFGDTYGLTLFFGALAFFMLYWRIGFLINDSYTVANGLVAVSEGHLDVRHAVYGPGLNTPGMTEIDGRLYARNYGQIVFALPFLWLVQGVAAIADLRVALAGGWALLLASLGLLVGGLVDQEYRGWDSRTIGVYVGSAVALFVFFLVIRGATTIEAKWHHFIALQLQTMVAAGLLGVVVYRLLTRMYDRLTGLVAGGLVVFASPISLWALFPKRHVIVSLAVFVSIYCLYRSRETSRGETYRTIHRVIRILRVRVKTLWRAGAYVPVGFLAWVNPLEGLLLLVGLLVVDVPTSGIDVSSHVAAGVTCLASLVPFFITNTVITGNPLEPSDTFGRYGSDGVAGQHSGGTTGGGGGTPGTTGGSEAVSSTPVDSFFGVLSVASDLIDRGVSMITSDLDVLMYVFVRTGYIVRPRIEGDALRLSYLEAMPVGAVLIGVPIICLRYDIRRRFRDVVESRTLTPIRTVDAFVIAYGLLVTLVFAPRFPLNAEITIRYLLVLFSLTAYGILRLSTVRWVVRVQGTWIGSAYLAGVLIGGQLLFLYMYVQGVSIDEAFQIHSYVGLALAALIVGWMSVNVAGYQKDRIGAIVLGLGAASSTIFVLVILLWFSKSGGSVALPLF